MDKNITILYNSKTQFEGISAWAGRLDYMPFKLWGSLILDVTMPHWKMIVSCKTQQLSYKIFLMFLAKKQHGLFPSIKKSNNKNQKQKYEITSQKYPG